MMERLVSDLIDAAHGTVMTEDQEREDTARTALLDYARGVLAERDALMLEFCPQEMTEVQKEKWARNQQPVGAAEVPMPQGYAERPR